MQIPKEVKLYCEKCKSHKTHTLKQFKQGQKRAMGEHTRKHEAKHVAGYGGKARHVMPKKKQGKRPTYLATCKECSKKTYYIVRSRAKKQAELV
jgi:ribosomal protein L44E